jgi:hypothetical protein
MLERVRHEGIDTNERSWASIYLMSPAQRAIEAVHTDSRLIEEHFEMFKKTKQRPIFVNRKLSSECLLNRYHST